MSWRLGVRGTKTSAGGTDTVTSGCVAARLLGRAAGSARSACGAAGRTMGSTSGPFCCGVAEASAFVEVSGLDFAAIGGWPSDWSLSAFLFNGNFSIFLAIWSCRSDFASSSDRGLAPDARMFTSGFFTITSLNVFPLWFLVTWERAFNSQENFLLQDAHSNGGALHGAGPAHGPLSLWPPRLVCRTNMRRVAAFLGRPSLPPQWVQRLPWWAVTRWNRLVQRVFTWTCVFGVTWLLYLPTSTWLSLHRVWGGCGALFVFCPPG